MYIIYLIILVLVIFIIHIINKDLKNSILIVLGSGGHTQEMLYLIENYDFYNFDKIHIMISNNDSLSELKFFNFIKKHNVKINIKNLIIHKIPRSRNVGQSKFTSIFTLLYSLIVIFFKILKIGNIKAGIFNGPGVCLPVIISYYLLKKINWKTKLIFFESFCRVNTLSVTGKIVKNLVNEFIVLWEQLHKKYQNTKYFGNIL